MFPHYTLDKKKKTLLEQLYYQYRYLMLHTAFDILRDYNLAEDAVHTAFLKLAKINFKIDDFFSNKTKNFMVIVIRGTAIDIYNKTKKDSKNYLKEQIFEIVDTKPLPLELILNNDGIDRIKKTLRTIGLQYADVIILKYFYDLPNKKISGLLSISEQTVRVRLHRARKILASKLNKEGAEYENTRIK